MGNTHEAKSNAQPYLGFTRRDEDERSTTDHILKIVLRSPGCAAFGALILLWHSHNVPVVFVTSQHVYHFVRFCPAMYVLLPSLTMSHPLAHRLFPFQFPTSHPDIILH